MKTTETIATTDTSTSNYNTTMKPKYPTKNEILKHKTIITKEEINILQKWKKTKPTIKNLKQLITKLTKLHKLKIKTKYNSNKPAHYNPTTKTINLNNFSIITTLHETGHAIHGQPEIKACAYSIQLFKKIFPKEYKKLKWIGHMLKKDE